MPAPALRHAAQETHAQEEITCHGDCPVDDATEKGEKRAPSDVGLNGEEAALVLSEELGLRCGRGLVSVGR